MFRLWAKIMKNGRIVKDTVIKDDSSEKSRTRKVFDSLELICHEFDLGNPIWLDSNISEFKRFSRTNFNSGNFMEPIDFDRLEIQIIEE